MDSRCVTAPPCVAEAFIDGIVQSRETVFEKEVSWTVRRPQEIQNPADFSSLTLLQILSHEAARGVKEEPSHRSGHSSVASWFVCIFLMTFKNAIKGNAISPPSPSRSSAVSLASPSRTTR